MTDPIPKIIHQVWIAAPGTVAPESEMKDPSNVLEKLPLKWRHCSARYKAFCDAAGWEYRVWTNASARELIATHFPWFLEQYDGYAYAIQRADAIRYFILQHYGGIYSDLDMAPKANFTAFYEMYKNADVALASNSSDHRFGTEHFINGFLMSKPGAEFWTVVWKHLKQPGQSKWWKRVAIARTHYFKILFTTGPGIICDSFAEYDPHHTKLAVIPAELVQPLRTAQHKDVISTPESVVELVEGESWQQKDANVWRAMGEVINNAQWILLGLTIAFFLVIVLLAVQLRRCKRTAVDKDTARKKKALLAYGEWPDD